MICPSCDLPLGEGWCEACDAENDRLNSPEAPEPRMDAIRAEIAETAGAIEATEERTPMPDVAGYTELLARIPEGVDHSAPWRAEHTGDNWEVRCETDEIVCTVQPWTALVEATEAHLIALAPALADALRTLPAAILRYLYAEAGVRARMLGATDAERLAHAAVRQDIRELAERFGVGLEP